MDEAILMFCCHSCLKGNDDDKAFYKALDIENPASTTTEDIRRAYKKASLNLHPDKLAQRGVEVTAEHKQQFLQVIYDILCYFIFQISTLNVNIQVKEAYDVLSDPKRRKLYDKMGATGMKLIESPQDVNPIDLLRNFQSNKSDRASIGFLVAFIFAAILVLPILFSLKCDQTLGKSVPWLAIWTPMWVVDAFLLISAVGTCISTHVTTTEDGEVIDETIPFHDKFVNFVSTVLFILLQIFILIRLDKRAQWSWFGAFGPWFVYEFFKIVVSLPKAVKAIVKPDTTNLTPSAESVEDGHGDEDILFQKIKLESEYFDEQIKRKTVQKSIKVYLLRIWLAIFLALELDHDVAWNWGLVLLPIWIYLLVQLVFSCSLRSWANSIMLKEIDIEAIDPENVDPYTATKIQQAQGLYSACQTGCLAQLAPLFSAILLVSRIQTTSNISTFIIILPIFIAICCCCCFVSGGLVAFSCVDADALEAEQHNQQGGAAGQESGDAGQGSAESPVGGAAAAPAVFVHAPPYEPPPVVASSNGSQQSDSNAVGTDKDPKSSENRSPLIAADSHSHTADGADYSNVPTSSPERSALDVVDVHADIADIDD